ncbi:Homeobox-leucine zipper protein HAT14 [Heracleum sosnowskyi]|uniref:Homeobox-leucine zipper protein HAT14 n=1 Tax=Heracleum sosnowskyi TaxID=360622 RepID=A0AAD8M9Q5_9APIA|nr:Homeobox-leucine zipper protein HAT14 [Heracleum sosnowskyi]
MELGLSLGESQKSFKLFGKTNELVVTKDHGVGFCMGLAPSVSQEITSKRVDRLTVTDQTRDHSASDPSVQLHLFPFSPPHQPSHQLLPFPWLSHNQNLTSERGNGSGLTRKQAVAVEEEAEGGGTDSSSPDSSMMSSFRMEFDMYRNRRNNNKREHGHVEMERGSNSRGASDEEEDNGVLGRKKLRLTKDQSAFLEESFKEHHTLNPKQKLALAKQLNLRPRQVEVWFQNRRARTKLKQTEVDCEYLKRCCETLTEENRRLQKELQELRALKSSKPFYMQLPATTLTMCPSCERVASTTTTTSSVAATAVSAPVTKPRLHPFLQDQGRALQASSYEIY